ncbi:hypothetical protein [Kineococcus sp. SYSU DK002]|uniref:hypothetical protein n=1 Tax=Kineococcus sp. SYSU DK002 TaxID=3383123 RepID=UPI003D7C8566
MPDDDRGEWTVYLTWRLDQPWDPGDLDALARELPGRPCVQDPTDAAGRVAVVSLELAAADEEDAVRAARAAVLAVLRPRGLRGRALEAVVRTGGAARSFDRDALARLTPPPP